MKELTRIYATLLLALSFLGVNSLTARAQVTVKVNPGEIRSIYFDGFGCSLAWWANQFGNSATANTMADLCFTSKTVPWQGDTLPGLGMRILRYNIGGGGGGATIDGGTVENVSPNMPNFKNMLGFWRNWFHDDPASDSWDWTKDLNQRSMMARAKERGVTLFEFWSDSPPWWMCTNHSTAGSDTGGDNLQSWNYEQFPKYLATVVKYARDHWGVNVNYVEPFNEPSAWWWKYPSAQEGCHFDTKTQISVLNNLRTELNNQGLQKVGISASDENDMDTAYNTWTAFDKTTRKNVTKVNVHGYYGLEPYRGVGRPRLRQATAGKKIWMSEYGESDATGFSLANSIVLDLNELRANAWIYWQPFDSGGWGLIQSNPGDNWIGTANRKFFVFAQFSRHIKQGYRILGSDDPNTVIAYSPTKHKLDIVTVNFDKPQWISYDLSAFSQASAAVSHWTTTTRPGNAIPDRKYSYFNNVKLDGMKFRSYFYPYSVCSFEISNIY